MARNVEAARTAIELHLSAVGRPAVTTGETC